jgi:ribosomal protein S17
MEPQIETQSVESDLIQEIKARYEMATKNNDTGDDSFYAYFDEVAGELIGEAITYKEIYEMLMEHICEELTFEEELEVLNYMASTDDEFNANFESHFEKSSIEVGDIRAQVLYDPSSKDPEKIYVLNDTVWEPAGYTDKGKLMPAIQKKFAKPRGPFFSIVGFMGKSKNGKIFEFKIKDSSTKFTGAVVENKSKDKIIAMLNETLEGHDIYNKKNTASTKKQVLSSTEEFLLRYFDRTNKNKKRYFLNKSEYYYLQKN